MDFVYFSWQKAYFHRVATIKVFTLDAIFNIRYNSSFTTLLSSSNWNVLRGHSSTGIKLTGNKREMMTLFKKFTRFPIKISFP